MGCNKLETHKEFQEWCLVLHCIQSKWRYYCLSWGFGRPSMGYWNGKVYDRLHYLHIMFDENDGGTLVFQAFIFQLFPLSFAANE